MKKFCAGRWEDVSLTPPDEAPLKLEVNGVKLVTIQCSPDSYSDLGAGFLFTNGIIDSFDEIETMRFSPAGAILSISLRKPEFPLPRRLTITSGFGGGPVFGATPPAGRIESGFIIRPGNAVRLMTEMKNRAVQYKRSGAIHAAALCSGDDIVLMAEDVGRQNTMDKVIGRCLIEHISFNDKAMFTTGRISFEMVLKAARAGIPVLASLSSPTVKAVELASEYGIAVAGYVTGDGLTVYTHEHRFCCVRL